MTSPHRYLCPLRWGDLDMLGHTNNVRYLDYVQEARLELLTDVSLGAVEEGFDARDATAEQVVVVRHDVSFDAPLMFREAPVAVETTVTQVRAATVVVEHLVLDRPGEGAVPADAAGPRVYFRARSELCVVDAEGGSPRRLSGEETEALERFAGPAQEPPLLGEQPGDPTGETTAYPVRVRWTDADAYGHVGNVAFVEYLQEARLRMLGLERWSGHGGTAESGGFDNMLVVARSTLTYHAPMRFRLAPYEVRSWVSRIGGASFDVSSVVVDPLAQEDEPSLLARGRVTLVGFDPDAQRSAPLTDASRAVLERLRA